MFLLLDMTINKIFGLTTFLILLSLTKEVGLKKYLWYIIIDLIIYKTVFFLPFAIVVGYLLSKFSVSKTALLDSYILILFLLYVHIFRGISYSFFTISLNIMLYVICYIFYDFLIFNNKVIKYGINRRYNK